MKILLNLLAFVLLSTLVEPSGLTAQEVPAELLEKAKIKFEEAFQAEYGEPPLAKATEVAMDTYKRKMAAYSAQLGTRAGLEAVQRDSMELAVKELNGLSFMKFAAESRAIRSLNETDLKKADVAEFAEPEMAINQLEGEKLIENLAIVNDLEDNTEIMFPSGSFELNEQMLSQVLARNKKAFPKGIAFVGNGKSETTLKVTDMGLTRGDVEKLSFRDMTIDCDNDGMFDKRQGRLVLKLSNVRLVRFDAGHGGCDLFSINDGLIVHAEDSDFLGGFGRSPGNGNVFERCDVLIGHFERCSFIGINYDLLRSIHRSKTKIWMDECQFDKNPDPRFNVNFAAFPGLGNEVEFKDCIFDANPKVVEWSPKDDR